MEAVWRAAGLAVVAAALSLLLKKDSPVFAFAVGCAAAGAVLVLAAGLLSRLVDAAWDLAAETGVSAAEVGAVLKALGIAVVTRFAEQLCADAGLHAAASAVELCGTAGILLASLPLILGVLDLMGGLL